jgi:hypothetical protein
MAKDSPYTFTDKQTNIYGVAAAQGLKSGPIHCHLNPSHPSFSLSLRVLPKIPYVYGHTAYVVFDKGIPLGRPDFCAYDFLRYCTALVALHRVGYGMWDTGYAAFAAPIAAAAATYLKPHQRAADLAAAAALSRQSDSPLLLYPVPGLGEVSAEVLQAAAARPPPPGLPVLQGLANLRCLKLSVLTEADLPFTEQVSQLQQLRGFECSIISSSIARKMEGLLGALLHLPQLLALGLPGELLCRDGCLKSNPEGVGRVQQGQGSRVQRLLLELAKKPCLRKMVFTEPRREEHARWESTDVVYCSHDCWRKGLEDLQMALAVAAAGGDVIGGGGAVLAAAAGEGVGGGGEILAAGAGAAGGKSTGAGLIGAAAAAERAGGRGCGALLAAARGGGGGEKFTGAGLFGAAAADGVSVRSTGGSTAAAAATERNNSHHNQQRKQHGRHGLKKEKEKRCEEEDAARAMQTPELPAKGRKGAEIVVLKRHDDQDDETFPTGGSALAATEHKPHPVWGEFEGHG